MKEIERNDPEEVPGGFRPGDNGCIPPVTMPVEYPTYPIGPFPEPVPGPTDPEPFSPVR